MTSWKGSMLRPEPGLPGLGDLQALISNMVIGNCKPAGRPPLFRTLQTVSPSPGEGQLFLFGSVLSNSYCVVGLGPALFRELAGRTKRGRGRWKKAGPRAVNGLITREPKSFTRTWEQGSELNSRKIYWRPL